MGIPLIKYIEDKSSVDVNELELDYLRSYCIVGL